MFRAVARRAKKRKRIDEYDAFMEPLTGAKWKELTKNKQWYSRPFEDMESRELVQTIELGPKMGISSDAFWKRASSGCQDLCFTFTPKQLASVVHAFATARWRDDDLLDALSVPICNRACDFRPSDAIVVLQGCAWLQWDKDVPRGLAPAIASQVSSVTPKGVSMAVNAYGHLRVFHEPLYNQVAIAMAAWPSGITEEIVGIVRGFAVQRCCSKDLIEDMNRRTLAVKSVPDDLLANLMWSFDQLDEDLAKRLIDEFRIRGVPASHVPSMLVPLVKHEPADSPLLRKYADVFFRSMHLYGAEAIANAMELLHPIGLLDSQIIAKSETLLPKKLYLLQTRSLFELLRRDLPWIRSSMHLVLAQKEFTLEERVEAVNILDTPEVREAVLSEQELPDHAQVALGIMDATPDGFALAYLSFPFHSRRAEWKESLCADLDAVSPALLPALLPFLGETVRDMIDTKARAIPAQALAAAIVHAPTGAWAERLADKYIAGEATPKNVVRCVKALGANVPEILRKCAIDCLAVRGSLSAEDYLGTLSLLAKTRTQLTTEESSKIMALLPKVQERLPAWRQLLVLQQSAERLGLSQGLDEIVVPTSALTPEQREAVEEGRLKAPRGPKPNAAAAAAAKKAMLAEEEGPLVLPDSPPVKAAKEAARTARLDRREKYAKKGSVERKRVASQTYI